MQLPRLVVNTKAYPEASGRAARPLAERVAAAEAAWCVPACDLAAVQEAASARKASRLQVWAQHVDAHAPGAATGWFTAEMAAAHGAVGTLLNHAEHKLPPAVLGRSVERARQAGLRVILCADSLAEARSLVALAPDAVAIEPPELIGGDVSVTSADPAIILDTVHAVHALDATLPVLCGAGVKSAKDVRAALGLGAYGVLVASGVVKAADPAAALADLAAGLA